MQPTKLDYSLSTIEERKALVEKILEENPNPNEHYLEIMANYLINPLDKAEKQEQKRKIISKNRRETLNKHEISYEGLAASLESGEDGIYNLIGDKQRVTKMNTRRPISQHDIDTMPPLKDLTDAIAYWRGQASRATGKRAYQIKQTIIEISKCRYVIRDSLNPPIAFTNVSPIKNHCGIYEDFFIDSDGKVNYKGASYCSPKVCSAILCNYSRLKEEGWDDLEGDLYFFMLGFDKYCDIALKDEPILRQIVIDKIDGLQNNEIQEHLDKMFGMSYSTEYISSLYRNKIPKLIASAAEDDYIQDWFLNHEKGTYKKCSRCGEIKIAHPKYFSKNSTSNDGFYSICKECRNKSGKNP